jgi:hypothetical protein
MPHRLERNEPVGANREPDHSLALHRSPAQLKLAALLKEHKRLLGAIRQKRATRDRSEAALRDAAHQIEHRVGPLQRSVLSTLREVHALFDELLGAGSALSRKDRARIRRTYLTLLPELPRQSSPDAGERETHGRPTQAQTASGGASYEPTPHASACRPDEDATLLRRLFRQLVVRVHPDRQLDPQRRVALTAAMKQITLAYEAGDVARLVQLGDQYLSQPAPSADPENLNDRIARLLEDNKQLRRQLRELTTDDKELKRALPRIPGTGPTTGGADDRSIDAIEAQLQDSLARLRGLRDLTQRMLRGQLDVGEFLQGPAL